MDGFRVILAGKGLVPGGLCPPQAGRSENKKMVMEMNAYCRATQPSHASSRRLRIASAGDPLIMNYEIGMENLSSVEAGGRFSKLTAAWL